MLYLGGIAQQEVKMAITDYTPQTNDYVVPDAWRWGELLLPESWEGATFRLPVTSGGPITSLAINIRMTGRKLRFHNGGFGYRCEVEFVREDDDNVLSGAWIFPRENNRR